MKAPKCYKKSSHLYSTALYTKHIHYENSRINYGNSLWSSYSAVKHNPIKTIVSLFSSSQLSGWISLDKTAVWFTSASSLIPKPVFNVAKFLLNITNLQELLDCSRAVWARLKHVCEHLLSVFTQNKQTNLRRRTHTQLREQMRFKFPRYLRRFPVPASSVPVSLPEAQRWPSSVGKNVCVCVSAPAQHSPPSWEYCRIVRSDSSAAHLSQTHTIIQPAGVSV